MNTKNKITVALCWVVAALIISCTQNTSKLYISPNGSDNNPGTKNAPFKSLEKARDAVRLIKKNDPEISVLVVIKNGTYQLESPVIFTSDDAGTAGIPVIYQAEEDGKAVFSGSKKINNWSLLNDQAKLDILDTSVRNKIYKTNLKELGISDFGDPTELGKRPELFCNKQLQTLVRWPNESFTHAGKALGKHYFPKNTSKSPITKKAYLNTRTIDKTVGQTNQMHVWEVTGIGTGPTNFKKLKK